MIPVTRLGNDADEAGNRIVKPDTSTITKSAYGHRTDDDGDPPRDG